ncbi:MAG: GNAT family N-acetyltransferase, partial [Acidimicrobiia bacterium]|nr:GNAT family N-acetyltransferase [Acidimicrobiia bacterium]
ETLGDLDHHRSTAESLRRDGFGPSPLFSSLLAWPRSVGGSGHGRSAGQEAVGACVYLPDYSTTRAQSGVYILDLVVVPALRGSGVGLELMGAAAEAGRRRWNADYVILAVARTNLGAQRFYQRHGFVVDETSQVMTLQLDRLDRFQRG